MGIHYSYIACLSGKLLGQHLFRVILRNKDFIAIYTYYSRPSFKSGSAKLVWLRKQKDDYEDDDGWCMDINPHGTSDLVWLTRVCCIRSSRLFLTFAEFVGLASTQGLYSLVAQGQLILDRILLHREEHTHSTQATWALAISTSPCRAHAASHPQLSGRGVSDRHYLATGVGCGWSWPG